MSASRELLIRVAAAYVPPSERELCARCVHYRHHHHRPTGRCAALKIDVATRAVCRLFERDRVVQPDPALMWPEVPAA